MHYSIRPALRADAHSIVAVLNPIIEAAAFTIMSEPVSVAQQARFMRDFPVHGVFNVAVGDDSRRVLGLQDVLPISTEPADRHVGEISTFVALDVQRTGIGAALCRETFRQARQLGFRKLIASIREDNQGAVTFYRQQGFQVVGTTREHAFVRTRYVDLVLTERHIA